MARLTLVLWAIDAEALELVSVFMKRKSSPALNVNGVLLRCIRMRWLFHSLSACVVVGLWGFNAL